MLDVMKFILEQVVAFLKMLFTIDVGNGINLGLMMCIIFIFLPCVLIVVNFLKVTLISEIDEKVDWKRSFGGSRYVGKHEYKGKHAKR